MRGYGAMGLLVWLWMALVATSAGLGAPSARALPTDGIETALQLPWHGLGSVRDSDAGTLVAVIDTRIATDEATASGVPVVWAESQQRPRGAGRPDAHGRWVAGLVAGRLAGACPQCRVLSIGTLFADRRGNVVTDDTHIAQAIGRARRLGARVINLSLGGEGACAPELRRAIGRALDAGVVIVAAAGNTDGQRRLECPANVPGVISVGALEGTPAGGLESAFGQHLRATVWALGDRIVGGRAPRDGETRSHGSSFAAPIVSGVVGAWIGQHGPPRGRADVARLATRLQATAMPSASGLAVLDAGAFLGTGEPAAVWKAPGIDATRPQEWHVELREGAQVHVCGRLGAFQVYPFGADGALTGLELLAVDPDGLEIPLGPAEDGRWRVVHALTLRKTTPGRAVVRLLVATHAGVAPDVTDDLGACRPVTDG